MPGFDKSGPQGMGSMTGGARGFCGSFSASSLIGRGYGRGPAYGRGASGMGRGFRRGFGAGSVPALAPDSLHTGANEMDRLKAQQASLQNTLDQIRRRLAELENTPE